MSETTELKDENSESIKSEKELEEFKNAKVTQAKYINFDALDLIKGGKNRKTVVCERCNSKVLLPDKASYVQKMIFLPHMKKCSDKQLDSEGETLMDFWNVNDMYIFENVGFSLTVGTIKYLTCADCEIGPIGMHDLMDQNNFYIALDRIKHV